MKTLRIMSLVGIVLFPLGYMCIPSVDHSYYDRDYYDRDTFNFLMAVVTCYGIAFSIVTIIKVVKAKKMLENPQMPASEKLLELNELRKNSILSDDEFSSLKSELLKNIIK